MGAFAYVYVHHLLALGAVGSGGHVGVAHHFTEIVSTLRNEDDIRLLIRQLEEHLRAAA
jgi:hypothetical protein